MFTPIALLALAAVGLFGCAAPAAQPSRPSGGPAAASAPAAAPAASQDPIKIGETMPLTGTFAEYGGAIHTAIVMAAEEVNQAGGINGRRLEVLAEDTQADPKSAVAAALKLITVDKVPVILTSFTGQTLPQIPVADEHQVVIFANSSLPTTASKSPWAFNTFVSTPHQTQMVTEFAIKELGYKRFVAIACSAEQCRESLNRLEQTAKAEGVEVAATEMYDPNQSDFRTSLAKLQGTRADAMLLLGTGGKAEGLILKQMAEMGYRIQVLGQGPSIEGPDVKAIAGDAANGVIYASSDLDLTNPTTARFVEGFKGRLGKEPDFGQVLFYDTTHVLAKVLAKTGTEPTAIREGLLQSGPQRGAAGEFLITPDRTAEWKTIIKVMRDGNYVAYTKP
jgi:branched-chain amino acid transport system substrate-binding protein